MISGNNGAIGEVSQVMTGLEAGKFYAASVWVQCRGTRTASINVLPLDAPDAKPLSNYVSRTKVRHSAPNDPRTGSYYERLKVLFELPPNSSSALLTLKAESSSPDTAVEFDDVRVVPAARPSPEAARHYFYEDFENVDQGYGPFTCCPENERIYPRPTHHLPMTPSMADSPSRAATAAGCSARCRAHCASNPAPNTTFPVKPSASAA